jgi:hypothetical protein
LADTADGYKPPAIRDLSRRGQNSGHGVYIVSLVRQTFDYREPFSSLGFGDSAEFVVPAFRGPRKLTA